MFQRELGVRTPDGEMTTFMAHPWGPGPFPVAVLFMDGIGYREQIRANARRFAAGGYYVVAPDLYYRHGKISFDFDQVANPAYRQRLLEVVATVTPERALTDLQAVFASVTDDPLADSLGPKVCVGYCMGARLALHAAAAKPDDFVAVSGIHPGALFTDGVDSPHFELAAVRADVYFAFAENDHSATAESVERFRAEVELHGIEGSVERLLGKTHGFAMADLSVYDAAAAELHFERTLALWARSLAKRSRA